MSILFYDHLIDRSGIHRHLASLNLPAEKHDSFRQKVDDILHSGIMEMILQKLHPHHHHTFLSLIERAPYDPHILIYLKETTNSDIEQEIVKEADRLTKLILKDLSLEK